MQAGYNFSSHVLPIIGVTHTHKQTHARTHLQAGYNFSSHVLAVAPAAIIGITAGLFAIVFTELNLAIVRLRDKLLGA